MKKMVFWAASAAMLLCSAPAVLAQSALPDVGASGGPPLNKIPQGGLYAPQKAEIAPDKGASGGLPLKDAAPLNTPQIITPTEENTIPDWAHKNAASINAGKAALPDAEMLEDEQAKTPKNSPAYKQELKQGQKLEQEQNKLRHRTDSEFKQLERKSDVNSTQTPYVIP